MIYFVILNLSSASRHFDTKSTETYLSILAQQPKAWNRSEFTEMLLYVKQRAVIGSVASKTVISMLTTVRVKEDKNLRRRWCYLLWAVETERNHHWGTVSNAIDAFEPSTVPKTATIWAEARKSDFTAWQRSASRCQTL